MRTVGFTEWKGVMETLFVAAQENDVAAVDIWEEDPDSPCTVIYVGVKDANRNIVVVELGENYQRMLPAGSAARLYELWLEEHEESGEELFYDLYEGERAVKTLLHRALNVKYLLGVY